MSPFSPRALAGNVTKIIIIIIIIIIIAEMAVFNVAGCLRERAQMACDYCFHTRTMFQINSVF